MAYSDELKARKRSYVRDLERLGKAKRKLEDAKNQLKDDEHNSLVTKLKDNLVVDNEYYEKESLKKIYEKICSVHGTIGGYISRGEYNSLLRESDISFVTDDEDTLPGRMYKKMVRVVGLKRIAKRCLGKL